MPFGSCCILYGSRYSLMDTKSVEVRGKELGLLVNFEVIQTFYHEKSSPKEVSYIFPNDLKMCIYDTTFVVGEKIIKPKLEPKDEAKKTYQEAVETGHTAIYGSNNINGLTCFKLGNVPPNTDCKIIIKVAFTANMTKQNSFFIKFPLDVYTPNGSPGCLDTLFSSFQFQLQCDKEKIKHVKSNVRNFHYNKSTKLATIQDRVYNQDNEHSIILNFETKENIQSSVLVGETINGYDNCVITISPNLEEKRSLSTIEFIFLIDCSSSMSGNSIKKASECLDLFIRSLPVNSYFNIIKFGTTFEKLFDTSVPYSKSNIQKALNFAAILQANLRGTKIYEPLKNIYEQPNKFGQRQVFIMTDGEVKNPSKVIKLVSTFSNKNRCFTIGIGKGCDAGLVEGIANSSGGKCDFVQEGDSISEKVIPQLESSLYGLISSVEIHIESEENDDFQVSPYPIPSLACNGCCLVYLRSKKKGDINEFENKNFLITLNQDNETVDIPIEENIKAEKIKEDKYGCSNGRNIGKSILPLFAFQQLQKYEKKKEISQHEKNNAIELSISSGVLCKFTGYIGVSKEPLAQNNESSSNNKVGSCSSNNIRNYKRSASSMYNRNNRMNSKIEDRMIYNTNRQTCKVCQRKEVIRMCRRNNQMCNQNVPRDGQQINMHNEKQNMYKKNHAQKSCNRNNMMLQEKPMMDHEKTALEWCNINEVMNCKKIVSPDSNIFASEYTMKGNPKKCCKMAVLSDFDEPKIKCDYADLFKSDSNSDSDIAKKCVISDSSVKKNYDLMTLLHSQSFTGYWKNLGEINAMLRLNVSKINGVDVNDKKIAIKCVATILALAALHVKSMDQKNLWKMIEIKAIDWLKIAIPNADINQLIKDTESLINNK